MPSPCANHDVRPAPGKPDILLPKYLCPTCDHWTSEPFFSAPEILPAWESLDAYGHSLRNEMIQSHLDVIRMRRIEKSITGAALDILQGPPKQGERTLNGVLRNEEK